jgi:hypothetical protein
MITLPNIDGKIWQLEYRVADILKEYQTTGRVDIDLNSEGPCCQDIGLYNLLDYLHLDSTKVTIHTRNQLEKHDRYRIKILPNHFIRMVASKARDININKDNITKHFSCFIGRSNWIRLWLASQLPQDKTLMTFHWDGDDFHKGHIGLDDMMRWNATTDDVQKANDLLNKAPIVLEEKLIYPVLSREMVLTSLPIYYDQFFCEIVCETYFSGNTFFLTEKTLRPIGAITPFIIHGPVNFLQNLKELGYKTFDRWWSEEYDMYGHQLRIYKIQEVIRQISSWSIEKIQTINEEMQPILKHNRNILLNSKE